MCGKTTLFQKIYYLCHGNKINIMKAIVGNNLKKMRVANNLTQEKFADFLNINRSAYANYESGERETPLEVLEKAASLFGCEISSFFNEEESITQSMFASAFRANDLCVDDMQEIANFKNIVMNYLKMERLLNQ